jgi:hypothetical protein
MFRSRRVQLLERVPAVMKPTMTAPHQLTCDTATELTS